MVLRRRNRPRVCAFDPVTIMAIRSYRDLIVWQKAAALVTESYARARSFPPEERYGLVSQIRRAAVSITGNIAEGHGRQQRRDYWQFLSIARGSLAELESHFDVAEQLGYVSHSDLEVLRKLADEVSRMLATLLRKIRENYSTLDRRPSTLRRPL